jgi:acyl transferase domain-containing protein
LTGEDIAAAIVAGARADSADTDSFEGSPAFRFSVSYSLAKWWLSVGIAPRSLIGVGVGEVAVGCLSGVFDLKDAVKVVAFKQSSEGINALRQQIRNTKLSAPAIAFVSRLTGRRVTDTEAVDINYWLNSEPGRYFSAGVGNILEDDRAVLIEVSTGNALAKLIKSNRYSRNRIIEPMFGNSGTRSAARELLAKLISSGVKREFGITA